MDDAWAQVTESQTQAPINEGTDSLMVQETADTLDNLMKEEEGKF